MAGAEIKALVEYGDDEYGNGDPSPYLLIMKDGTEPDDVAVCTIPIIAMTANAFSDDVQNSLAAGMDAHVSKPIDIAVLEKTMRAIIIPKKFSERRIFVRKGQSFAYISPPLN